MITKNYILIDEYRLNNLIFFLKTLPLNSTVEVKIGNIKRSNRQNTVLWAVAYPVIMKETGLSGKKDAVELHKNMCGEYFGWETTRCLGRTIKKPVRTTTINEEGKVDNISTSEFSDFYEFVKLTASEFGIFIPDPEKQYEYSS